MNQTKDNPYHIHLDGLLSDKYIWKGNIDWRKFEIRNPQNIYDINGKKYNGDNPKELIDELSPYYNLSTDSEEIRLQKESTIKVKKAIIGLSQLDSLLTLNEKEGATKDEMKEMIENHFDVTGLVDYMCFHLAVANHDGFAKNWQWLTYDGKKWYVAPYDLDCIMGYIFTGNVLIPADFTSVGGSYNSIPGNGPMKWVRKYYLPDIKERWKELRSLGVLSAENIKSIITSWYYRIGDNYKSEWEKWPNTPCINKVICNEGWEYLENRSIYNKTLD